MRSPAKRGGSARARKMRGKDLRCGAIAIAASSGEAFSDAVEIFQPTQRSECRQGRRSRAPASHDTVDRSIVDRFDAPDDLQWIERRAVNQEMLRQLFATCRGALERHQQTRLYLRLGTVELDRGQPVLETEDLLAHRRQEFGRLGFAGAGIDAEQSAVAVTMDKRVDRVHQPPLLA